MLMKQKFFSGHCEKVYVTESQEKFLSAIEKFIFDLYNCAGLSCAKSHNGFETLPIARR